MSGHWWRRIRGSPWRGSGGGAWLASVLGSCHLGSGCALTAQGEGGGAVVLVSLGSCHSACVGVGPLTPSSCHSACVTRLASLCSSCSARIARLALLGSRCSARIARLALLGSRRSACVRAGPRTCRLALGACGPGGMRCLRHSALAAAMGDNIK